MLSQERRPLRRTAYSIACAALLFACGDDATSSSADGGDDTRATQDAGADDQAKDAAAADDDPDAAGQDGADAEAPAEDDAGAQDSGTTMEDAAAEPDAATTGVGELGTCTFEIGGTTYEDERAGFVGDTEPLFTSSTDNGGFAVTCANVSGDIVTSIGIAASGITGVGVYEAGKGGAAGVILRSTQSISTGDLQPARDLFKWKLTLTELSDTAAAGSLTSSVGNIVAFHARKAD